MPSLILQINVKKTSIIKWTGLIANIPKGYQICDGTNGTPDLRAKFVRGAAAGNQAGGTGGADTVTLDSTMIPSHNHSVTDPKHSHPYGGQSSNFTNGFSGHPCAAVNNATSGSNTASVTINNNGSGGSHENRPQFYEVIYISKTSGR